MLKNHGAATKTIVGAVLLILGLAACKDDTNAANAADDIAEEAVVQTADTVDKASITSPVSGTTEDFVAKLERARPGLKVIAVQDTQVEGLVRVDLEGAGSVYSFKGTDFFVLGELYQVQNDALVNISEQEKEGVRANLLATLSSDDMILFSPAGEIKKRISVFTDVDCGYCQKLHKEVPQLNAMGIEVRYLAFPRAGIGSPGYQKLASAWCADDPQDAITQLKNRKNIPINVCDGNPVAAQYNLGGEMGVRGTPAIILDNGEMLPGYMEASALAERLGI